MLSLFTRGSLSALLALFLAVPASAQWSSDAASNLSVGDAPSDQAQPKVAPTPDGGCYVSWLDGIGSGYDVRLQRLDAQGYEQWAHGGVLVADRGYSSTQDYGLDVDASGAALLAFRDDSSGTTQITAQRIDSSGSLAWGAGVQLTNTAGFLSAPKIAGAANGDVIVAWAEDGVVGVMRLLSSGVNTWASPVLLTPPAGLYTVADLHDTSDDVILSMVHQTTSQFFAPKHLVAQKLSPTGAGLWGASPVAVFDGGSLQIGNFPPFSTDGAGGAVFAWYGVSPLMCYAQRLDSGGAELFAHNGVAVTSDLTGTHVEPHATFDAASSSTVVYWSAQNSGQTEAGVSGQSFDATGAPQWGATGKVIVPISSDDITWIRTTANSPGSTVAWLTSSSFGNTVGNAAILDTSGGITSGPLSFASTVSGKTRLAIGRSLTTGDALLAWTDDRVDNGDVLAQNLRPDGGLGNGGVVSGFCFGVSCPCSNDSATAGCINSTGAGARLDGSGSASLAADDLLITLSQSPPGQPALLFFGDLAVNGGSGLPFGDGLRCVGGSVVRVSVKTANTSGVATWGPGLGASEGWSAGDLLSLQTWYRDPAGGPCSSGFNLSHAVELSVVP